MVMANGPVLVVETPSSPYGHRYIVLPGRVVGDMFGARYCSRLDREGISCGADWIGCSQLGAQKAFGGGRTAFRRAVLAGVDVDRLTPEQRSEIESNLEAILSNLDTMVLTMDWTEGAGNLVVTSEALAEHLTWDWDRLPISPLRARQSKPHGARPKWAIPAAITIGLIILAILILRPFSGRPTQVDISPAQNSTPNPAVEVADGGNQTESSRATTNPTEIGLANKVDWDELRKLLSASQERISEDNLKRKLLEFGHLPQTGQIPTDVVKLLAEYYAESVSRSLATEAKNRPKAGARATHVREECRKIVLTDRMDRWNILSKGPGGWIWKFTEQEEFKRLFLTTILDRVEGIVYEATLEDLFGDTNVCLLTGDTLDPLIQEACNAYLDSADDFARFKRNDESLASRRALREAAIKKLLSWPGAFMAPLSTATLKTSADVGHLYGKGRLVTGQVISSRLKKPVSLLPSDARIILGEVQNLHGFPKMLLLKREAAEGETVQQVGTLRMQFEFEFSDKLKKRLRPRDDRDDPSEIKSGDTVRVEFDFPLRVRAALLNDDENGGEDPWVWRNMHWESSTQVALTNREDQRAANPFEIALNPMLPPALFFPSTTPPPKKTADADHTPVAPSPPKE